MIVGESFNRHMSNLYDGKYDTNPRLKALSKQGSLFLFNDVVASDNGTTQNFKQFLSPVAVGDGRSWCDAPLFPFLLRRCGYNVVFYSNQYAGMEMDKEFNASMGFFNAPGIGPYLFVVTTRALTSTTCSLSMPIVPTAMTLRLLSATS